jgi:hypothetical protein
MTASASTYAVRFEVARPRRAGGRFGAVASLDGAQHDALVALLYGLARTGALRAFDVCPVVQREPVTIDASGRAVPPGRVLPPGELCDLLRTILELR